MPHVVDLDLKPADFRLSPAVGPSHHWLVLDFFGRALLIRKLRQVRPDLRVPQFRVPAELLPVLDQMIDLLELREWPEPATEFGRAAASVMVMRLGLALSRGEPLPDWRGGLWLEKRGSAKHP